MSCVHHLQGVRVVSPVGISALSSLPHVVDVDLLVHNPTRSQEPRGGGHQFMIRILVRKISKVNQFKSINVYSTFLTSNKMNCSQRENVESDHN